MRAKRRVPEATRSQALVWVLGRAFGIRVESTSQAEAAKPIEVPTKSQLNVRNVRATAARTGLSRLSIVYATWDAERARV